MSMMRWLGVLLFVILSFSGCVTVDEYGNPIQDKTATRDHSLEVRFNRLLSVGLPLVRERLNDDEPMRPFALALSGDTGIREVSLNQQMRSATATDIELLFQSLERIVQDDSITAFAVFAVSDKVASVPTITVHLEEQGGIALMRLYPFVRQGNTIRFESPQLRAVRPLLMGPAGRK
ncbi:hypothetical protein QQM79_00835 [Marinobacteraceae bacterium S3BR75-40.1]